MLNKLHIKNFTCFSQADLRFSKGLNVIIGENGTGKSHLLKLAYSCLCALYDFAQAEDTKQNFEMRIGEKITEPSIRNAIESTLCNALEKNFKALLLSDLISGFVQRHKGVSFDISFAKHGALAFFTNEYMDGFVDGEDYYEFGIEEHSEIKEFIFDEITNSPVFFPVKEVISVYEGFAASLRKRELGFDNTYLDFADALALKPLKNVGNKSIKKCITLLESSMNDYTVESQNDSFYFYKKTAQQKGQHSRSIPAKLFAEGHNKLGTLSYLLRNGSIQEGTTLFWDEPEANMNPRLLKVLAEVLVEMSEHMQIILSTHSLFLMREIDILARQRPLTQPVMFTGLHVQDDQSVQAVQSENINDIGDITALDAALEQSERFMQSRGK